MSDQPQVKPRAQIAMPDEKGVPTFEWPLTSSSITDTVKLIAGPFDVLPVVFVPGIMGSNLKAAEGGAPVWRLDEGTGGVPWGLLKGLSSKGAGARQKLLHPKRCVVDDDGKLPEQAVGTVRKVEEYKQRGWGTVGQGSYHKYLLWLEQELNPIERNPALWTEYSQAQAAPAPAVPAGAKPKLAPNIPMRMKGEPFGAEKTFAAVTSDDVLARSKFLMPVYAVGYNWLASNRAAALDLQKRIFDITRSFNRGRYRCEQVILVTHSMGGLVARACAALPGMADKIAGIVHGVMPAVGAAVAYRRCKVGMRDEDFGAGLVIGSTGPEVTAVFAQAPGALQLLPSQAYSSHWLRVQGPDGHIVGSWPTSADPYDAIYSQRERWWGLVNEAWLAPVGGEAIKWETFLKNVIAAKDFHEALADSYHSKTFVYYGADAKQKSFERVTWRMAPGLAPDQRPRPPVQAVLDMNYQQVRMLGSSPEYVGGTTKVGVTGTQTQVYQTSYWELHCHMQDGAGDGTVPISSGSAPLARGGGSIQQQFKLTGFAHEPAFKDATAQRCTLYAITKIVGKAKRPE